jgi:tetratricopeptide (TPR) repeat protein
MQVRRPVPAVKLSDVGLLGLGLFLLATTQVMGQVMSQIRGPAQTPLLSQSVSALYRGEPAQAAELARKHLNRNPHDARGRVILARAELALGEFASAFEDLRKALADDPRNVDGLYYMAVLSKALAQKEYQRLYSIAPDSMRVHLLLAEASLAEENYTEAESQLKAALAASPRSVEVLTALGELKRSQSKFDEAIDWYRQAELIGPLNYDIVYGLGACFTYKQEHSRAVEYLKKAVVFAPESGAGRFALGNALFQAGDAEAAIPELVAALKMEPRLKQAYFVLGRAYQKVGREAEARATFSKLDELNRSEAAGSKAKP